MTDQEIERRKRQRQRSIAIGLALGALVIIFYVTSIVKMGSQLRDLHQTQIEQPKS